MDMDTQLVVLAAADITAFLNDKRVAVGRLASIDEAGFPYVVPVHFVYHNDRIYIHGSAKGGKIDNILRDAKAGFEAEYMGRIIPDEMPCKANTTYTSVIARGHARLLTDTQVKHEILMLFVEKYLPGDAAYKPMPEKVIDITGVIEMECHDITGRSRIMV